MTSTTDDLDAYRAAARTWLESNLPLRAPGAELRAADEISPEQLARGRALQRQVYEAGYLGIAVPVEYGGQGRSQGYQRIWNEESARYAVPAPGGIASHVTMGVVLPTILAHGSEDQKRAWVPKILSGEEIWVQLLSEPGAGSDLAGLLTRATRDGDVWVLSGTKVWSSGAMSADYGICLARTDWDAPKHRGLTWFKVPLADEHLTVRPIREINGGAEFCEEFLDDVVVGDDAVLGDVNGGWPIANTMLAFERGAGAARGSIAARRPAPPGARSGRAGRGPGADGGRRHPATHRQGSHQRLHADGADQAPDRCHHRRVGPGHGRVHDQAGGGDHPAHPGRAGDGDRGSGGDRLVG